MMKYVLLASAMTLATPVLAQEVAPAQGAEHSTSHKEKKSKKAKAEQRNDAATTMSNDSAPVEAAPPADSASVPATPAPVTPDATTLPADPSAAPAAPQPDPMTPQTAAAPQAAPAPAAAPAQTAAAPADQGTQVAAILDGEFPTYDKDSSGSLNKTEFASWMDALKAKSDPAAKPDVKWNEAAFKQADKDKSKSVSKDELASFLSGANAAS